MRPRTKTPSEAVADAAERPGKVRCQTHPAEGCQGSMGTGSDQPPYFGRNLPAWANSRPQRLFLFWTVHGPFSLFLRAEKEKMGGAVDQPSPWLKSHPARKGRKIPPRPKGGDPPSRPRGADSEGIKTPAPCSGGAYKEDNL